jgi:hypothetical protein
LIDSHSPPLWSPSPILQRNSKPLELLRKKREYMIDEDH